MATAKKSNTKSTKAKVSKVTKKATADKAVKPKAKTKKKVKATSKAEVKVEVKPEVKKQEEPIVENKPERKELPRCKYCGSYHVRPSGYCRNCIMYGLDSLNKMFGSTDGWDKRLPKKREPIKTGWRGTWGEALRNVRTN